MRKAKRKHKKTTEAHERRIAAERARVAKESFIMFCQAVKMMPFYKRVKFCWNILIADKVWLPSFTIVGACFIAILGLWKLVELIIGG